MFEKKINSILKKLIKVGKVSEINYKKGTCKVVFEDMKEFQSQDLQVITRKTLKHKTHDMPDIDELVVCIFIPFSNNYGFVLGSIYTEENQSLFDDDRVRYTFEDGTFIEYDKELKQLTADVQGDVIVNSLKNIKATAKEKIEATADMDIIATSKQNIKAVATKDIIGSCEKANITSTTSITLSAPLITLDGAVIVNKTIDAADNITSSKNVNAGINLTAAVDCITAKGSVNGHTHTGNLGSPTAPMNE